MPSHRARPFAQKRSIKSASQETEIMHHGAETNKANMTHRIDRQAVQAVSIAVANINRMKRVLQRGKLELLSQAKPLRESMQREKADK